jgi:ferritin-like metal-binding protein YciE
MPSTLDEQLDKYLADAHSIEEQALTQMREAPDMASDPGLADAFRTHLAETERHERLVRQRLEARGSEPSRFKKAIMVPGGKAFVLFAKSQPDTTGKLTAHSYSYEALEQASYELLLRVARRAGDAETERVASEILAEEYEMAHRIEQRFDAAVEASLREKGSTDPREDLGKYLADAHALEMQAEGLLKKGPKVAGDPQLALIYEQHLEETRGHQRLVEERLDALGDKPSRIKDAAMRMGALNWAGFFAAHPDTPGKLAAFAYAFEHLEIAGYELLWRVARRAGDEETVQMAQRILGEEREAALKIRGSFDRAVDAALQAQGVATSSR